MGRGDREKDPTWRGLSRSYSYHSMYRAAQLYGDGTRFYRSDLAKVIPGTILSATQEIRIPFIRGLFDSDGSLIFSRKTYKEYRYPSIEIKSVSRNLCSSIEQMLVPMGFRASLNKSAESWVVRI